MGSLKVSEKLAMEIVKKTEDLTFAFELKIEQEDIDKNYISLLYDKAKRSKIVGFRKNKAPLDLIENYYRTELTQNAWKSSINKALYLAEKSTGKYVFLHSRVISKISKKNDENAYSLKAALEFYPEINTKKIKGYKLIVPKLKITEKDINEALFYLRLEYANYRSSTKNIDYNDKIECEITINDLNNNIKAQFKKDIQIKTNKLFEIASENESVIIDGEYISYSFIKDKLLGHQKDDILTLKKSFVNNDIEKEYIFNITILNVLEPKLPELNKNFIKSLGGIRPFTIEQLKEVLKNQLIKQIELFRQNKIKLEIINLLSEANKDIAIPKSLLIETLTGLKEDIFNNNETYDLKLIDYDLIIQAHRASIPKLILSYIITKYSINITEKDIEKFYIEIRNAGIVKNSDIKELNKQLEQYLLTRQAINIIKDSLIMDEREVDFREFLEYAQNPGSFNGNNVFEERSIETEKSSTQQNEDNNVEIGDDKNIEVVNSVEKEVKITKTKKPRTLSKKLNLKKENIKNDSLNDKKTENKPNRKKRVNKVKKTSDKID